MSMDFGLWGVAFFAVLAALCGVIELVIRFKGWRDDLEPIRVGGRGQC